MQKSKKIFPLIIYLIIVLTTVLGVSSPNFIFNGKWLIDSTAWAQETPATTDIEPASEEGEGPGSPEISSTNTFSTETSSTIIELGEEQAEAKSEETGKEAEDEISLKAESITYEKVEGEDIIVAREGVELKYNNTEIKSQELKINLNKNLFWASGEVFLKQEETETYCEEVTYNWKTEKIILIRLKGELTGEGIKGKIYFTGEKMENFPETVEITGGTFTTCDLAEPHYHLEAKELIIYPKDKIIARHISWYEGNLKIITLPYFIIFLDRKTQQPILPKIGQNSADGWYIKTNFNYYITEKSYGIIYADWLQKKGLGLGFTHTLEIGGDNNPGETSLYLYQIKNKDTDKISLNGELKYQQEFKGQDLTTQMILNYSGVRNPNGTLASNTLNSQFTLDKAGENYTFQLSGKYKFSGKDLDNLGINGNIKAKYDYTISDQLNSILTLYFTQNHPSTQEFADLELTPEWELKFQGEGYKVNVVAKKRFDLDEDDYTGENVSKIIDRLPEFTFIKSSALLGETKISYDINTSVAHFYEYSSDEDNWRGEFIFNLKRPFKFGDNISITPAGIFRQDVYLTGEARYLVGGKIEVKTTYNPYLSATLNYSYNKTEGPTPFKFDYIDPLTHFIKGTLAFTPTEKIDLNLSTNYDFVAESFASLVAKLAYKPKEDWKMNFNTSYNLNTSEWSKEINTTLDLKLSDNWKVNYKGIIDLEDWEVRNSVIGITRDLHCREIRFNYKQATQSFWLEFYIKAFPTEKITIGQQ